MLRRVIGSAAAAALLLTFALPFARESYQRYEVSRQLGGLVDAADRAAFAGWNGSASDFVASLRDRCRRVHGDADECRRYRLASD
jgi:hypothetical protein